MEIKKIVGSFTEYWMKFIFLGIKKKVKQCSQLYINADFILPDQFIYLSSNITSTENNVSIDRGKVWTAIDSW